MVLCFKGSEYHIMSMAATDRGQFLCIADNNVRPPADYAVQIEVLFAPYCKAQQDTVGQVQNRRFSAKLDCIVAGRLFQNTNIKIIPISRKSLLLSCNG